MKKKLSSNNKSKKPIKMSINHISIRAFDKKKLMENKISHIISFRHLDDQKNNPNQLNYQSFILTPTQKNINYNIYI